MSKSRLHSFVFHTHTHTHTNSDEDMDGRRRSTKGAGRKMEAEHGDTPGGQHPIMLPRGPRPQAMMVPPPNHPYYQQYMMQMRAQGMMGGVPPGPGMVMGIPPDVQHPYAHPHQGPPPPYPMMRGPEGNGMYPQYPPGPYHPGMGPYRHPVHPSQMVGPHGPLPPPPPGHHPSKMHPGHPGDPGMVPGHPGGPGMVPGGPGMVPGHPGMVPGYPGGPGMVPGHHPGMMPPGYPPPPEMAASYGYPPGPGMHPGHHHHHMGGPGMVPRHSASPGAHSKQRRHPPPPPTPDDKTGASPGGSGGGGGHTRALGSPTHAPTANAVAGVPPTSPPPEGSTSCTSSPGTQEGRSPVAKATADDPAGGGGVPPVTEGQQQGKVEVRGDALEGDSSNAGEEGKTSARPGDERQRAEREKAAMDRQQAWYRYV